MPRKRAVECLLGAALVRQDYFQSGFRSSYGRDADTQSLSQPLRVDKEGPDGQKYKAVPKGHAEGEQSNRRERREWKSKIPRHCPHDIHITWRLYNICRRI